MAGEPVKEAAGGVKLPYFHRTLSAEDSTIIGDIRPKLIDPTTVESSNHQGSAWNSAGSWEEKDITVKAKKMVTKKLTGIPPLVQEEYEITCEEVSELVGHASIVSSRGKPRYLFEFESIKIKFEAYNSSSSSSYNGDISLVDVTNDQIEEEDIEMNVKWGGSSSPGAELKKLKNLLVQGGLRRVIVAKLAEFESEFRNL